MAPASPIQAEDVAVIHATAARLGLQVRLYPSVTSTHPVLEYLSGTDRQRAADVTEAWCDPEVAAVWAARGGYGAQRMLDLCDWDRMAAAPPKVLLGYSDVSCVHEAVAARLGVVSLHAPMLASARAAASTESIEHLRTVLFSPEDASALDPCGDAPLVAVVPGRAEGWLTGGNLSVLSGTVGSATQLPSRAGALVFLEDVNEEPYRIDRMLSVLTRSGWFDGVAGVVIGGLTRCGTSDAPDDPMKALTVFDDYLRPLGIPVAAGLPVGHDELNRTLPLGVRARLDARAGTLRLLEPALS